ncbi:MAG: NlpC/P60 family protein [Methyloceanibacter sp.]
MINGVLPDPRRHAYREDLAAESLRNHVKAPRYVAGEPRQLRVPALPLRRHPRFDATLDSEALFGETLRLLDESEGWAWVQLSRDGYVGYMPSEGLDRAVLAPTHRVAALRTYVYSQPDFKTPPSALLSLNALLSASAVEGRFLALETGGFVFAEHARQVDQSADDFVAVALSFRGTPYLWGGRTSLGLDCSGLVQLANEAAGLACPRDADMQAAELGRALDWQGADRLARGDLVFWDGHVGIMADGEDLLHASAHHMAVVVEPFAIAKDRIAASGSEFLGARRPSKITGA